MDGKAKTEKLLTKWDVAEEKLNKIKADSYKWLTQMCKQYYKDTKQTTMYFCNYVQFDFAPLMYDYCIGLQFDKKGENIENFTKINHLNVRLDNNVLKQIINEVSKIVFK